MLIKDKSVFLPVTRNHNDNQSDDLGIRVSTIFLLFFFGGGHIQWYSGVTTGSALLNHSWYARDAGDESQPAVLSLWARVIIIFLGGGSFVLLVV